MSIRSRKQIYIPDAYVGFLLFAAFAGVAYLADWTYPILMWLIDSLRNP